MNVLVTAAWLFLSLAAVAFAGTPQCCGKQELILPKE